MANEQQPQISLVVPIFNEEDNILPLYEKIVAALEPMQRSWELILVDDGSSDRSPLRLEGLAQQDQRIVVIELRRNFGQTAAIAAGFHHARGKVVITLDADLQNDPSDIPELLAVYEKGYDVVSGWRRNRQDGCCHVALRQLRREAGRDGGRQLTGIAMSDHEHQLRYFTAEKRPKPTSKLAYPRYDALPTLFILKRATV